MIGYYPPVVRTADKESRVVAEKADGFDSSVDRSARRSKTAGRSWVKRSGE